MAGAATADSGEALRALDALAALDAGIALTGHGSAWTGVMGHGAEQALAAGAA